MKSNKKRPNLAELNEREDRQWIQRFNIPSGAYLVDMTDMDIGAIMGGSETEPKIFTKFTDALNMIECTDDTEVRVSIYDSNGDIVYVRWEALG